MYKTLVRVFSVLICCALLAITGCDPEVTTSPVLPGQQAILEVTFNPDPVSGYNNHYWFYITVQEINGVGIRLLSMKAEHVDGDGDVSYEHNYDENGIILTFGTSRLDALQYLRGKYDVAKCYGCRRIRIQIHGTDDLGNPVDGFGIVDIIPLS